MEDKGAVSYSLSDDDIKKIFKHFGFDIKIITYDELVNYNSFNEILTNIDACILHIPQTVDRLTGHWVALLKKQEKDKTIINFFDSFGKKPDRQLYYTPLKVRNEIFDEPYLSYILNNDKKNNIDIIFNCYDFQKEQENINTCGKWCTYRILYFYFTKNIYNNDFKQHIYNIKHQYYKHYTLDQMISKLMNPEDPKYI